jgi:signal peptidase I
MRYYIYYKSAPRYFTMNININMGNNPNKQTIPNRVPISVPVSAPISVSSYTNNKKNRLGEKISDSQDNQKNQENDIKINTTEVFKNRVKQGFKIEKFFKILDYVILIVLSLVSIILLFCLNMTMVDGISMANTYKTGDFLVLDIISRKFERGDIITVFNDNKDLGFPISNSINTLFQVRKREGVEECKEIGEMVKTKCERIILVKRVIAVGGEEIEMNEKKITVFNDKNPNGIILEEPYAKNDWLCAFDSGDVRQGSAMSSFPRKKIPNGEFFVMGDNRGCSQDSRYYGSFKERSMLGKVIKKLN